MCVAYIFDHGKEEEVWRVCFYLDIFIHCSSRFVGQDHETTFGHNFPGGWQDSGNFSIGLNIDFARGISWGHCNLCVTLGEGLRGRKGHQFAGL